MTVKGEAVQHNVREVSVCMSVLLENVIAFDHKFRSPDTQPADLAQQPALWTQLIAQF